MTRLDQSIADTTAPGEAERQAAELAAMNRMIEASQGCFSLSIAVCNSPALRDYVIGQICRSFPGIQVVAIPKDTVDVFGHVDRKVHELPGAAIFVTNLEASIQSEQERHTTVRSINASRERWEKYRCPIVLWLPEYAATLLSIYARDFWRYRSHRFEFVSEQAGAVTAMQDRSSGDLSAAAALSAEEKRFRIAELEQRIEDAGENPPKNLVIHVAVWLNELGFLYQFIGDLDMAEEMYRKALKIDEQLGRQEGMAINYSNLGLIYKARGDLDRAEEMLRKSLKINEQLDQQEDIAINYGNLGVVYITRGDIDTVRELWTKSRDLFERIGMPHMVEHVQGWLDELPPG